MKIRAITVAFASVASLALSQPAARADAPKPRGTYVIVPPSELPVWHGADISKILYINRCVGGCTIKPGPNDARTNTSSIPRNQITLSEFAFSDDTFNQTVECVRELYAPFDVQVVTDDPGTEIFHHEAILAGTAAEAELGQGVGGIAPLAGDCRAINNVISFSFANTLGDNVEELCWTVAQESAHAFGLDHEYTCSDPMTYVPGCSRKYFRDYAFPCGEGGPRQCSCGGSGQNSHRKLLAVFGPGDPGAVAPTVNIQLPANGETVDKDSAVFFQMQDDRGIRKMELVINGYTWDTRENSLDTSDPTDLLPRTQSSNFAFPGGIPDGVQNVDIVVYNDIGVAGTASVQVTIGAPCANADSCLGGQQCNDGACAWPAPTGELGDSCERDQDCVSDLCPKSGDTGYCSVPCNVNLSGSCDDGYECIAAGNSGVCWPQGGGGCCSVGRSGSAPWLETLLFGGVIAIILRRRRR